MNMPFSLLPRVGICSRQTDNWLKPTNGAVNGMLMEGEDGRGDPHLGWEERASKAHPGMILEIRTGNSVVGGLGSSSRQRNLIYENIGHDGNSTLQKGGRAYCRR